MKYDLQEQTRTLDGQLNNAKDQISDLVDELALNARISNEGKAVLLSRRVSRRENKWYLANWGENRSSSSSSSQYLAAKQLGVNLESLNKAARKAEEISRLQLEILQERQRIEQIIAPTQEQNDDSNQQQPKKKRRLFGIF